jgi:hypothetical protein
MYYITLVLDSLSDSCHISTRIAFSDCVSQSELTSVSKNFILKFSQRVQGWPPIVVFQKHDGVLIMYS